MVRQDVEAIAEIYRNLGAPVAEQLVTRALGELLSPKDEQPEVFRWTDAAESHVTCEFRNGRLVKWELFRPPVGDEETPVPGP